MTVSPYFRHTTADNERELIQSLTTESIYQRGHDFLYIPRTNSQEGFDYLFGEDPQNIYDNAVTIEMYCENVNIGFDGDPFIGRFGLEIPDSATFLISIPRFKKEMEDNYPDIVVPRPGDLIGFILDYRDVIDSLVLFEILSVDKRLPFYQIGQPHVYKIFTEQFNYSHEEMQTGLPEIDDIPIGVEEEYSDNEPMQEESDTIVDFQESDPFSDNNY